MRTALMIIDMQRSLLADETWEPGRVLERQAPQDSVIAGAIDSRW